MENFFGTPEVSIRTRGASSAIKNGDKKMGKSPFKSDMMETPSRSKNPLREITNSQDKPEGTFNGRSKMTPASKLDWGTPQKIQVFDESLADETVDASPDHGVSREISCTPQDASLSMADLHRTIEDDSCWKVVDESMKSDHETGSPEQKADESIYARIMKEAVHTLHRTPPSHANKTRTSIETRTSLEGLNESVRSPSLSPSTVIMETVEQLSTSLRLEISRREEAERRLHLFIKGSDTDAHASLSPAQSSPAGSVHSQSSELSASPVKDGDDKEQEEEDGPPGSPQAVTPAAYVREVSNLRERLRAQEMLADLLVQHVGCHEVMAAYAEAGLHEGGETDRLAGSLHPIEEHGRESEEGGSKGIAVVVQLAQEVRRLRGALEEAEAEVGEREEEGRRALEEAEEEAERREAVMREEQDALREEKEEAEGKLERVEEAMRGLEEAGKGALLRAAIEDLEIMEAEGASEEEGEEEGGEEGGEGYQRWEMPDGVSGFKSGLSPAEGKRLWAVRSEGKEATVSEVVPSRRGGRGGWAVHVLCVVMGVVLAVVVEWSIREPSYRMPLVM